MRESMARLKMPRVAGLVFCACLGARTAAAQLPEGPYVTPDGRVTLAGEFSATAGPHDTTAFFNYNDYNHDALRTVRVRLLGEWRLTSQFAFLGELRSENNDNLEAAALYLRWRPWTGHEFDVQAGRIPPVIGAFARHAYGRDNLVIGTPLAYQYLTSLRPDALPATYDDVLRMRARGWRPSYPIGSQSIEPGVALVSAFRWDTGVETHWQNGVVDLAAALTRGSPAVPVVRETNSGLEWSGRVALTRIPGLTIGFSAAHGDWIEDSVLNLLPPSQRTSSSQTIVGSDFEYGRSGFLMRAEWLKSVFNLPIATATPTATSLGSSSGFVEGRYRWTPRWQTSARAERLDFTSLPSTLNPSVRLPWDAPVVRVEGVVGYRALRNLELRAGWQYDWRDGGRVTERGYPTGQVLYWF
jgi:hypothetical protein